MWPEHVCMKGLCNALNNQFTTLMWNIYMSNKMINNRKEIFPRGNNKVVILYFLIHGKGLLFMLELYLSET